jgi:hypothetical protein
LENEENSAIMEDDEEVIFTMDTENETNQIQNNKNYDNTENKENHHEVTAIVEYCRK